MDLIAISLIVPAQSIIERELASYLSVVLCEQRRGGLASLWKGGVGDAGCVYQTEQEAGVRQSDVAAGERLPLRVRKAGLGGVECVAAELSRQSEGGEGVDAPIRTGFVGMIPAHQRSAGDRGRLV